MEDKNVPDNSPPLPCSSKAVMRKRHNNLLRNSSSVSTRGPLSNFQSNLTLESNESNKSDKNNLSEPSTPSRPSTSKFDGKRTASPFKAIRNSLEVSNHSKSDKQIYQHKRNGATSPLIGASDSTSEGIQRINLNCTKEYYHIATTGERNPSADASQSEGPPTSMQSNSLNGSSDSPPVNQSNAMGQDSNENHETGENSITSSSSSFSSSKCCRNHYCQQHSTSGDCTLNSSIPITCYRQQQAAIVPATRQRNSIDFGISSVQATKIISNHSNTEIVRHGAANPTQQAVTTLTSSSSCLPVTTLTVMESPKLSTFSATPNKVYNWQSLTPTVKDRMATIFNSEILADVYFVVGQRKPARFPAHKFVLSIGSAVFDAMFNGALTKANQKKATIDLGETMLEIEIPDVEPEAFRALLRFLYMDEVDIGPETVMATLYAAKKYEVTTLEMTCVDFLKENLTSENAFMLLTQARLFDESALADLCLETIDKHTLDTLCSDSFLEIDLDTLKLVLSRDTLRAREVSLFAAIVRWTEVECQRQLLEPNVENKRKVLGDALFLVRFPLMSIEEFAVNVAQSGLLTDKEMVNLFIYFTVSSKPWVPFSIEPRCCITGEECAVNRFQRTECRWGYSGTSDRIRFLTDRPIFVIGFGLFGSIHGPSDYKVDIEIIHTGSGNVLASNTTSFLSDGSDSIFRVMFQHPVEILQNTNYTACATLKGLDSFYGTNGCRTVTVNIGKNETKENVTFQFSYAAGCNNGTSVEDGQIPQILFYT